MVEEKKVKVIDYEAAWNDLKLALRDIARDHAQALAEFSFDDRCVEYASGMVIAYEHVLSIMDDILDDIAELHYEEAE